MNKVGLQDIVGGQLQEKFNRAFEKVVENLQDPNTSWGMRHQEMRFLDIVRES